MPTLKVTWNSLVTNKKGCAGAYRFGFNGMEKDDEIKGSGNSYDFGARIYDPRIARWLSVDPLNADYPDVSPYVFVINTPLSAIDPNGESVYFILYDASKSRERAAETRRNEIESPLPSEQCH